MAPDCRWNGHARFCFVLLWREHKCRPPLPQIMQLNFPGEIAGGQHAQSAMDKPSRSWHLPCQVSVTWFCYRNSLNSHRQSMDLKTPKLGVNFLEQLLRPQTSLQCVLTGLLPAANGLNGQLGMRPKSLKIAGDWTWRRTGCLALRTEPQRFPQGPDSWHSWAARRCQWHRPSLHHPAKKML